MATVRLSDVVIPSVYTSYQAVNNIESSAFVQAGVVVRNALMDELANGPSAKFSMPYWKDLDQTVEQNYSNDDPADLAVPQKIQAGQMDARNSHINQGWSSMDLVAELLDANPMQRIRERTATYWQRRFNRRIIAIAKGVVAENIATNSSDMGYNASIADGNAAAAANLFSHTNFLKAAYTLGDEVEQIRAIAIHSVVAMKMADLNLIIYEKDSKGELTVATYLGRRVIIDDTLPVVAGATSGFVYTSLLFGGGFIGYGKGTPTTPVAVARVEEAGNGGGMETLWERKTWLLHPFGHNWVEGTLAEQSPTDADLALIAHWERTLSRKNIGVAWLKTNG